MKYELKTVTLKDGNIALFRSPEPEDTAVSLAIALRREYWDRGIGTAMFRELIAAAKARGVTQLELAYIQGNDRGRALYGKMGFRPWGEQPDAIRQSDGTMRSLIHMRLVLSLHNHWKHSSFCIFFHHLFSRSSTSSVTTTVS